MHIHDDIGSVTAIDSMTIDNDQNQVLQPSTNDLLIAVDPSHLNEDQRRAYDIVDWHLVETIQNQFPPQLLMIIPGEGGVGKSKTIQTITVNFVRRNVGNWLAKGAYTGIAASIIDGKTLHALAATPVKGHGTIIHCQIGKLHCLVIFVMYAK